MNQFQKSGLGLSVLFFLILSTMMQGLAYGRSKESTTAVPLETVMAAVRDYGRGLQVSPIARATTPPSETEEVYLSHIRLLFAKRDFAQLEKIAQQNRAERGRVVGGIWKITVFYEGVSAPDHFGEAKDSEFQAVLESLNRWIAAYPDSATARIALARFYNYSAWRARGSGFANTVSQSQWDAFNEQTARAKAQLLLASKMKDRDPAWFTAMQTIAKDEGWDKAAARELLDKAAAFEPTYYHFYRGYADYLQPQWFGEPGDIKTLAEEVSARFPDPDGSIFYFQIASFLACYCRQHAEALPATSYPKMKTGYTNLKRLYGTTNTIANRFAFIAYMADDKAGLQTALKDVSKMDKDVWQSEGVYNDAREWAASQ